MAKYIKTFENNSAYVAYSGNSEVFVKPNLSYCIQQDEVHFTSIKIPTYINLQATVDDNCAEIYIEIEPMDSCEFYYKIDNGSFESGGTTDGHTTVADCFDVGTHTFYVVYEGDSQYKPCRASTSFTVSKLDSLISVTVIEDGEVRVEVPEEATGQVSASVLGGQTYYYTVLDGKAEFDLGQVLSNGTYSVSFQYLGDETFNPSNIVTETIIIPKAGINIE